MEFSLKISRLRLENLTIPITPPCGRVNSFKGQKLKALEFIAVVKGDMSADGAFEIPYPFCINVVIDTSPKLSMDLTHVKSPARTLEKVNDAKGVASYRMSRFPYDVA